MVKIHFVGCLGVSMKTLMAICASRGFEVSGSDLNLSGHDAKNVHGADLVVYTSAIDEDNVELSEAKRLGIATLSRGEMLGELASTYKTSVAVAGAHGKTTTTAMLWQVLKPLNPTVHIGGNYEGNDFCIGSDKLFLTEACEYQRSFLSLKPDIGVILNIDLDHTDCYEGIDDMTNAFRQFAHNTRRLLIINGDQLKKKDFAAESRQVMGVGLGEHNDFYAKCVHSDKLDLVSFCVFKGGRRLGRLSLCVAGVHNVINALCAVAAAHELGLDFLQIKNGLREFKGTQRRMELLGHKGGAAIYSDYAHHHSEIKATICAARAGGFKRVIAVFEPHTYTRTKSFCREFAAQLCKADVVVLLPIYAAREKPVEGVSTQLIAQEINNLGKQAQLFDDYRSAAEYLNGEISHGDALLFMGAGTIDQLARNFVKK